MPLIIPIFIPHQGCPHACIFCNQHRISGDLRETPVSPEEVRDTVAEWLERSPQISSRKAQVAFFGGSFTGLPGSRQQELLQAVSSYIAGGQVHSIRVSTRPDYIDEGTVMFLAHWNVATVELGVQSMDDKVLAASYRGHSASQTRQAVRMLRQGGMEIGLQVMLGLPGQTTRSVTETVNEVVRMRPDFVRIYPVLVLRDSRLNVLYDKGTYRPLSLDKAVVLAARMKSRFTGHGIRVVRMGLQPGGELENNLVAGPYHPAFGEMVNARIMLQLTRKMLRGRKAGGPRILSISDRDLSIFKGVKSRNVKRLQALGLADGFQLVTDKKQPRFTLREVAARPEE